MKKFLITNIFLSLSAVMLANYAAHVSFRQDIGLISTTQESQAQNVIESNSISHLTVDIDKAIEIAINVQVTEPVAKAINPTEKEFKNKITKKSKIVNTSTPETKKKIISKKTKVISKKAIPNNVSEVELSYTEVDEQKRIVLKSVPVVSYVGIKLDFSSYSKDIKIAKTENLSDRISTASAANEKSNNGKSNLLNDIQLMNSKMEVRDQESERIARVNPKKSIAEDDLVFYDLEKEEDNKVISPKKLDKKQIGKLLMNNTYSGTSLKVNTQKAPTKKAKAKKFFKPKNLSAPKIAEVDVNKVYKKGKSFTEDTSSKAQKNYECMQDSDLSINETFESNYELTLNEIDYSKKESNQVRNFEIRFHDDINEMKSDYNEGILNFNYKMNGQMSLRRGTIFSKGYYPTSIDIMFEAGDLAATIPVFTLDSFNRILATHNLQGGGAHLLVELDDKTEDVEIDESKNYQDKIYLDKNYKPVVRDDSAYHYILFVGIEAGNSIVKFKRVDQKIVTKLLYLANDEIYYEPNFYGLFKNDSFALYKEGLLSKCKSILNINADNIKTWSHESYVKKDSLNRVTIPKMIYPLGTRKYYELKYDEVKENIFVGRWSQEAIVVPTEMYIRHIIGQFEGSLSNNQCIVQLNLTKPIKEISFNGESKSNNMNMQINILDGDGKFYQDFSEQSKRVFLMGEEEGMISVKIDYADNSTQFLQSFCSESTYIVEQL